MEFRLVIDKDLPGDLNMAKDEAIFLAVQKGKSMPTLRFYGWSPPCLSLGYFQDAIKDVDDSALKTLGVDLVRRITGGKAVLHDNELTYSIAVSEKDLPGSIIETYTVISRGLLEGLRTLGVDAKMAEKEKGAFKDKESLRQACFSAASLREIVFGGKKLVGSAQARKANTILQHGSIPFSFDAEKVISCLNTKSPEHKKRSIEMLTKKATGLFECKGRRMARLEIEDAILQGFGTLGWTFTRGRLTDYEEQICRFLLKKKYSSAQWTSKRGKLREQSEEAEIFHV